MGGGISVLVGEWARGGVVTDEIPFDSDDLDIRGCRGERQDGRLEKLFGAKAEVLSDADDNMRGIGRGGGGGGIITNTLCWMPYTRG